MLASSLQCAKLILDGSQTQWLFPIEPMEHEEEYRYGVVNFEKRKHPRFNIDLPVQYRRAEEGVKEGRVLNASEGGLLLYLSEQMEIGQLFALKLRLPSSSRVESIEAMVQVAWTDLHWEEDWGEYRTGVRFFDISTEDLAKLKDFLRSLLSQENEF